MLVFQNHCSVQRQLSVPWRRKISHSLRFMRLRNEINYRKCLLQVAKNQDAAGIGRRSKIQRGESKTERGKEIEEAA